MNQAAVEHLRFAVRLLEATALGVLVGLLVLVVTELARAKETLGPAAAHQVIDTILVPRFAAAWSEWAQQHPEDKPPGSGSHYRTIDAGDVKRGHAMRQAFKELDARLNEIGY